MNYYVIFNSAFEREMPLKNGCNMGRNEEFLECLRQAVLDNLENEQFSVVRLAQIVNLSRSHLHRKLKKLTGQSISQFVREIRLSQALKLLKEDILTTSEIAYKVGFNSPSYFHKCFVEYYGYPPGEARNFDNKLTLPSQATIDIPDSSISVDVLSGKKEGVFSNKMIVLSGLVFLLLAISVFYFRNNPQELPLEKSIAVLPFSNLSADEENRHFADGLVEDLLGRLSLIDEFTVISSTSSNVYHDRQDRTAPEIADELGVSYIVEGSVQKYENKVRVSIQLIDAMNDRHLWAKGYDKDLSDVFKIQSDIAVKVVSALTSVLTEQQTAELRKSSTGNVKAFEWYQLGRHHWNKRTFEGLETSITYFEQAIAEDPDYALAIANLADSYFLLSFGQTDYKEFIEKAEQLASNALEIDDHLPEAYNVLGGIYSFVNLDWAAAENVFVQGLNFNPNHSNLHHRYAEHLSMTGRQEEARQHINKAIELDPLSFVIRSISAWLYCLQDRLMESLAEIKICNELIPDKYHPRINDLTFEIYYRLGNNEAALEYLKSWDDSRRDERFTPIPWDSIFNASGIKGLVMNMAEMTEDSFEKAIWYGLCNEHEKAMYYLEKAYRNNPAEIQDILSYSNFNELHSTPRFIALMKKMNLPWSPGSVE